MRCIKYWISTILTTTIMVMFFTTSIFATSFDEGIAQITDVLIQGLYEHTNSEQIKTIAVADFITIGNEKTELSKYIAENIIISLTNSKINNLVVLERQRLNSVLEEHNLMTNGIFKGDAAQKIGELLGADIIIIGNYYNLEKQVHIIVKMVSVINGKIYSATKITVEKNNIIYNILGERYLEKMVYIKGGVLKKNGKDLKINSFAISKHEVTHKEYINFLNEKEVEPDGTLNGHKLINLDKQDCAIGYKDDKFFFKGNSNVKDILSPIIEVTWWGAIEYCNWLSEKSNSPIAYNSEGKLIDYNGEITTDITKVIGYRLPTDHEWEFAARGGNQVEDGDIHLDDISWYWRNSGEEYLTGDWDRDKIIYNNCRIHPVGEKKSNAFGIYDMIGNVWEWTTTSVDSNYIVRGGSWFDSAKYCNYNSREYIPPEDSYDKLGFRPARSVKTF